MLSERFITLSLIHCHFLRLSPKNFKSNFLNDLMQIKCICLMLINNNKLNNNKLSYLRIVGVYMNMLSLKICLSSLESSKLSFMIEAKIIILSDVFLCMCVC